MMKKKIALLLSLMMLMLMVVPSSASTKSGLTLMLDGKIVTIEGAYIEKGRTMVPVEFFNAWGVTITTEAGKVVLDGEYTSVELTVGNTLALIHHKFDFSGIPQKETMEVAPVTKDQTTFVPLRLIAEAFNARVIWQGESRTIEILSQEALDTPIAFTVIDPKVVRMTEELSTWFYGDPVEGVSFKVIGETTYIKVQSGEKPSGGYSVSVNEVYDLGDGRVFVDAAVLAPNPDDMVTMELTYPVALIQVENTEPITTLLGEIQ